MTPSLYSAAFLLLTATISVATTEATPEWVLPWAGDVTNTNGRGLQLDGTECFGLLLVTITCINTSCPDPDDVSCPSGGAVDPDICSSIDKLFCNVAKDCCGGDCMAEVQALYSCIAVEKSCTIPDCKTGGGGGSCFSEKATVQVQGKGNVAMKDLQVGDHVLTGNLKYQPVYAFGHYHQTIPAEFVQIQTYDGKDVAVLELTSDHLVFLEGKSNPVWSASVKVGDVVQGEENGAKKTVTKVGTVQRKGLYAPLTQDGTLLVDGIKASTYLGLQKNTEEYLELNGDVPVMSLHFFVHLTLAPFRMICMGVSHTFCHAHNEDGVSYYIAHGIKLCQWFDSLNLNIMVQAVLLSLFALAFGFILTWEAVFGARLGPLAMLIAAGVYYAIQKRGAMTKAKEA